MRRFSDRLSSTPSLAGELNKEVENEESSDIRTATSPGPTSSDCSGLVEIIGLHETVKVLEAEYKLIAGGDRKTEEENESQSRYRVFN